MSYGPPYCRTTAVGGRARAALLVLAVPKWRPRVGGFRWLPTAEARTTAPGA
jgi:hypothetical protein